MMTGIEEGRMLTTSTESGPHEKKMKKKEETAENDQAPRHGGPHVIGIGQGGRLVPGMIIGLLSGPWNNPPMIEQTTTVPIP